MGQRRKDHTGRGRGKGEGLKRGRGQEEGREEDQEEGQEEGQDREVRPTVAGGQRRHPCEAHLPQRQMRRQRGRMNDRQEVGGKQPRELL